MVGIADFATAFVLGLLTPLTAVCVLPLYPGFLVYLANRIQNVKENRLPLVLGLVVVAGAIVFMSLLGLVFTTVLQVSLTNVIGVVSPIAFFILAIISLLLIFDVDIGKYLPRVKTPALKNPMLEAFGFGFFFGAIVVPCNPLFIAALFTVTAASIDFVMNIISFLFFGLGIGAPLLVLAALSSTKSAEVIGLLTRNKRWINFASGIVLLAVSIYYLVFVFRVLG